MSQEKRQVEVIYAVPPSVDAETWEKIESRRLSIQEKQITLISEIAREVISGLKEYYTKKATRLTLPAYIIIGIITAVAGGLTWVGKISGETFSFLAGSIAGYIISVLAKQL